ncbi:hypothetical protein EJB05_13026, partial [Eragrostis curvula]
MGSASSKSSPKRVFSLRSVAPAAALIFLVLVFVAGAISTLHHNGGGAVVVVNDWDTSRPWAPPPSSSSRKMLRDDCIGRKQQRRRTPPGVADVMNVAKQRLPRGLAHETTNLEMEASLAGDPLKSASAAAAPAPESAKKNEKHQKSLLAVPVGIKNKAAVDKLVSKFFLASDDQFSVMLFHYDGAVESWSDLAWSRRAVHVSAPGQTKLWFAKRFLHPDVVAEYEYVFLWDEDLEVDSFDPARYLAVVRREGLEVSQPALDRASEIHHAHTARSALDVDVHRGAGWVEVMAPVFSRDAWRCAWRMLGYCARGDRAVSVGVVDSEYVLHRGVPVLGDGDGGKDNGGRGAVRWRSFKEMQIFEKRWEKAVAEDESWTDPYAAQPPAPSSP